MFKFEITASDKKARCGWLVTPHGIIETPAFLPVGTQASVKALSSQDLEATGCQICLASTYHLYLRPGADTIRKLGGIHKFMHWDRPVFTDSGGFQVFSLGFGVGHGVGKIIPFYLYGQLQEERPLKARAGKLVKASFVKIDEEGPTFQSHLDGTVHFFPPERSMEAQVKIGADFVVALDELTSPLHDYNYTKMAMERTHRWEMRSLDYFRKNQIKDPGSGIQDRKKGVGGRKQEIFGVVQGGPFEDLRVESARFVNKSDFFGVAVGGALVNRKKMTEILDWIYPNLDSGKPRHLLGIGTIPEIFLGVERGMDMFDAVVPTRLGRMGHILCKIRNKREKRRKSDKFEDNILGVYNKDRFAFDITKAVFGEDDSPIDPKCPCFACRNYSRAYIHHLFRSRELLAYRLATIHNVEFMMKLMAEIQQAIREGKLEKLRESWFN